MKNKLRFLVWKIGKQIDERYGFNPSIIVSIVFAIVWTKMNNGTVEDAFSVMGGTFFILAAFSLILAHIARKIDL